MSDRRTRCRRTFAFHTTLSVNTLPTSAKWLCEDLGCEVMASVEFDERFTCIG